MWFTVFLSYEEESNIIVYFGLRLTLLSTGKNDHILVNPGRTEMFAKILHGKDLDKNSPRNNCRRHASIPTFTVKYYK